MTSNAAPEQRLEVLFGELAELAGQRNAIDGRIVEIVAEMDRDEQLIVGPEKMNTARPLPASEFAIKSVQFFAPSGDHDGSVPELVYAGESDITAREHLAENMVPADSGDDPALWLAALLADGPRWATEVFDAAKTAGISEKKARTAKRRLNIEAARTASNVRGSGDFRSTPASQLPSR